MLNTDAYNRLIASLKETDEITAIAVQALLNKSIELLDQVGFDIAVDDLISGDEWNDARQDFDNLRYAEIELSSYGDKNYDNAVKAVQAYLPRGWFATLRTRELGHDGSRCGPDWHEPACTDSFANHDTVVRRTVISITGRNNHGWTLDDYVIPRLASGNWFAKEVTVN